MTNYTERNNKAIDEVASTLGLEDAITIWFCSEVEINPQMSDDQLAHLKEMALRDDDDWDEE